MKMRIFFTTLLALFLLSACNGSGDGTVTPGENIDTELSNDDNTPGDDEGDTTPGDDEGDTTPGDNGDDDTATVSSVWDQMSWDQGQWQ